MRLSKTPAAAAGQILTAEHLGQGCHMKRKMTEELNVAGQMEPFLIAQSLLKDDI
jgi:hypothetical protein